MTFIEDFEDLKRTVLAEVREGDLVLVKGSRSLGLERLADLVSTFPEVKAC